MATDTREETQETNDTEEFEIADISDEEFLARYNAGEFKSVDEDEDTASKEPSKDIEEPSEETVEESVTDDNEEEVNDNEETKEEPTTSVEPSTEPNYKEAYSKIFKPFKANGKEITPESPDDVISLMQMGANYVKKMTAMKEHMKTVKMLESAGITSVEDINFLIDIKNKNPEAIKKFLKDSDIDPTDLDMSEIAYSPKDYSVSDSDIEFSSTVDDLKESPHFATTTKIVSEVWDKKSKEILLNNPNLLRQLNEEVEIGRYDKIQSIIDRERIFGRLKDKSDLEAYIDIVSKITQEGTQIPSTKPKESTEVKKPATNASKKSAALTSSKGTDKTGSKTYSKEDILSMDDSTFLKIMEKKNLY